MIGDGGGIVKRDVSFPYELWQKCLTIRIEDTKCLQEYNRTKLLRALPGNPVAYAQYDLAADYATREFSGVDIAGLICCAGSIALSRARKYGGGVEGLLITLEDVKQAFVEVRR